MLSHIELENWRCAESLSLPLEPLTALVGPNGAGKTAVLDAIDFALGGRWPGMGYLNVPRDFYGLDTNRDLRIACTFDPPLTYDDAMKKTHEIPTLEFSCRPYKRKAAGGDVGDLHDDFIPLTSSGEAPVVAVRGPRKGTPPEFGPLLRVYGSLRDQARVLMIGDRRTVASHASGRRGSVLNLLLASARKDFSKDVSGTQTTFKERYEEALTALRTEAVQNIESTIANTAKQMLGFLGSRAVNNLDITFGFADPSNPFSSLTVMCQEGEMVLPAESMGLGIQSAIVVGVFDALRRQNTNIGTVLIEEPEMYLHPQAQRFFHRLLTEMVDEGQCQVIYTTHSPIFADMTRFRSIRLLQKPASGSSQVEWVRHKSDQDYLQDQVDREKLGQYMDPATSEALFARRVLLVEGHGDRLAAQLVAQRLGLDLDAEGLSVVACGGKAAIPFYGRMCRALGIQALVLHDEDVYEADGEGSLTGWQVEENAKAPGQNAEIASAVGNSAEVFVLKPSLEVVLGIGRGASDKPLKVVERLEAMDLKDMPSPVVEAVRALGREAADGESVADMGA